MKKLLEIYGNKIITNISELNSSYYYFYNNDGVLFGIEKTISSKEYALLKLTYQEKNIYNTNVEIQKIYEFLYDNNG